MQILDKFSNFTNEIIDTLQEKNPQEQGAKTSSVVFKALGAALMIGGASLAIGIVTAIPAQGLSVMALASAIGLAILGYDLAEVGDAIRRNTDQPVTEIAKGLLNGAKNMWKMGAEKGAIYTQAAYFAADTIIISKILKLAVALAVELDAQEHPRRRKY